MRYIDDVQGVTGFVLFSASWCQPCQKLKPHIIDSIDYIFDLTQENPTDVRGVPTIRAYDNGEVVSEIVGPTLEKAKEFFAENAPALDILK